MRPSMRGKILDAAVAILDGDDGVGVSFESVARRAGVTKSGLMYHFPTKEALDLAIIDHVAHRWEAALLADLGKPVEDASAYERIAAYVRVSAAVWTRSDFTASAEANSRPALSEPWYDVFSAWLDIPDSVPERDRARLTAARFAADGLWYHRSTRGPSDEDADAADVVEEILRLTRPG